MSHGGGQHDRRADWDWHKIFWDLLVWTLRLIVAGKYVPWIVKKIRRR